MGLRSAPPRRSGERGAPSGGDAQLGPDRRAMLKKSDRRTIAVFRGTKDRRRASVFCDA
jgi:hypothetical protein